MKQLYIMGRLILRQPLFFLLSLFFICNISQAQPGKDGPLTVSTSGLVVNKYTRLTANITAGANTATVNNIATDLGGLQNGDLIMIIQMQGASITTTDDINYGSVSAYNNAGKYEFKYVTGINSNTFRVNSAFANSYTVAGHVQVVKVPQYSTLTVNSGASMTAPAWDGATGGIVAIHAQTTITVNGTITVDAKGFRGGAFHNASDAVTNPPYTSYRSTVNTNGGEKGEGIAGNQSEYTALGGRYSRGAPANGGGGGNTHNAGGGGGANGGNVALWTGQGVMCNTCTGFAAWALDPGYTANGNTRTTSQGGGRGGYTRGINDANATTTGPGNAAWGDNKRNEVGGLGGRPLTAAPGNRIFLGGGGGAGDANSNSGGNGGNGGGLIYLLANTVTGTGSLSANGQNGSNTTNQNIDAASGGGAGGTIVIDATSITNVSLNARGGNGGSQVTPITITGESEGPGGGGGGGFVAVPTGSSPTIDTSPGINGTTASTALNEFPANGATSGNNGSSTTFSPTTLAFVSSITDKPIITVSKRVEPIGPITQGTPRSFYYIITVQNSGPGTATGVEVRDDLALIGAGVTYTGSTYTNLDGTASGGGVVPGAGVTNLTFGNYTLPPNSAIELYFQVNFNGSQAVGIYNNSASAYFDDPTSAASPVIKVTPGGTYTDGSGTVGGSNYNGAAATLEDVTINNTNNAPTATNNSYTAKQSVLMYGNVITDNTGAGVDSDPDAGTRITVETDLVSYNTAQGKLVIADNGQFSFVSAPGFTGVFTFTYNLIDNGSPARQSNTASVTIQVNSMPDTDGDGIADITDLDDDNDGILDIMEAGCGGTGVINTASNLIVNGNFNQGIPASTTPDPQYIAPGGTWGSGTWTSGVAYNGYNVYPVDTRIAIQRGVVTYSPIDPTDPAVPEYGVPGGYRVVQGPFAGDAPFNVPASDTYLYSNGNSLGVQYVICRQTISGLTPGRDYILVSYTSNAINPILTDPAAPEDGIMQFYVDNAAPFDGADAQPVGEGYVVYKDGDPKSGHNGKDLWDRRQVVFRATAPTAVFELRDAQLGINGDDFVITYAGVFPYNDYSCASLPADPSGDEDGDGVANWQDADDPALGALGLTASGIRTIYASLDPDGDGLLSQFDLDSDGDGCPDAKEAVSGATVNADGTVGSGAVYGYNGFFDSLELMSTTGGTPVETGTINYTLAATSGKYNFLNKTIFTACSNNAPTASNIIIRMRKNTAAYPNSHTFTTGEFGFADADGNSLASVIITSLPSPAKGKLTFDGTDVVLGQEIAAIDLSKLVFTPKENEVGDPYNSFQFKVRDNTGVYSVAANTVTIIVYDIEAVDDLPGGTPITGTQKGLGTPIDVLANDIYPASPVINLNIIGGHDPCFTVSVDNISDPAHPKFIVTPGNGCTSGTTYTFNYNFEAIPGVPSNNAVVTFTVVDPIKPIDKTIVVRVNSSYTFNQGSFGQGGTSDFRINPATGNGVLQKIAITQLPLVADGQLVLDNGTPTPTPVVVGTVIDVADIPKLRFIPAPDKTGTTSPILYAAIDGNGSTSPTTGTITFNIVDAVDDLDVDAYTSIDVLNNDIKASIGTPSVRIITNLPSSFCGKMVVDPTDNTTVIYEPNNVDGCTTPSGDYFFEYVFDTNIGGVSTVTSDTAKVTFKITQPTSADKSVIVAVSTPTVSNYYTFKADDFKVNGGSGTLGAVFIESVPSNAPGNLTYDGVQVTAGTVIPVSELSKLKYTSSVSGVPYTTFTFKVRDTYMVESPTASTMTVNVIEAKDDPTIPENRILVVQKDNITIPVLANDVIVAGPTTLTVSLPPGACFDVNVINNGSTDPTINFVSKDCPADVYTFTYTVTQGALGEEVTTPPATVTVTVVPKKPVIKPGATITVTFPEDNRTISFDNPVNTFKEDVQNAFDYEPGNDPGNNPPIPGLITRIKIGSLPHKGTLVLVSRVTGDTTAVTVGQEILLTQLDSLLYEPVPNENGERYTSMTIYAAGAIGEYSQDAALVLIDITPVPDYPLAQNDYNVTLINTPVIGNALSNDSDPDAGDLLTATEVVGGTPGGTMTITNNGTYTYTPPPGFFGIDTYTYTVCDQTGLCSKAVITIVVNDTTGKGAKPPIARNDNYTTIQNKPISVPVLDIKGVLDNDSNPAPGKQSELVVTAVTNALTAQGGVITINGDGSFTYTPKTDFVGIDTYTYIITNAVNLKSAATITIFVNSLLPTGHEPPVARNDSNRVNFNKVKSVSGDIDDPKNLLHNDDPKGVLSIAPVSNWPTTQGGTITVGPDGSYTYHPRTDFLGTDTYTYTVCDDKDPKGCATATLFITINIPPVAHNVIDTLINPNRPSPPEPAGQALQVVALDKPLIGTDEDGTVVGFLIKTLPEHGILYYTDASNKEFAVSITDTLTSLEASTLVFEPETNYSGITTFTYIAIDNETSGSLVDSTYTLVIINRPLAFDDEQVVVPNTPNVPIDAAANDSDRDDGTFDPAFSELDPKAITIITPPAHGTATVTDGIIYYSSTGSYEGLDSLVYVICDSTTRNPSLGMTDNHLCDTAVVRFIVRPPFIPEGFTPNGDGQHDFFVIENPNNDQIHLQVFNRWGNLVYESKDFKSTYTGVANDFPTSTSDWNGKSNRGVRVGEELPDGTYFYIIKFKNSGFNKSRYMTIIR
ncbi:Ig-like domain-containing protein [Xanthocytophaga flava]|uniref:Ig-like domain-containing protein n=1 Tax=Xanthocytophaga flava TaxID=3048013 RepID=UPI0028D06258|nr:Ig-like domain-containing protein [Xanthocytophaga flavus]MDJ1468111.1 Ig-like domain-containing protein [Xanthocytophaga flavus]